MSYRSILTIVAAAGLAACSWFDDEPSPLPDSCFTGWSEIIAAPVVTRGDSVWRKLPTLEEVLEDLEVGETLTAKAALGILFDPNLSILTPSLAGQVVVQNEIYRRNCK